VFVFVINYCCDMFRPQFLAYVVTYAEEMDFIYPKLDTDV